VIAQRTLAQDMVCVSVNVALLVSATQTDQVELQRQVRDALNRFVPGVEWVFSILQREANPTVGYEQINVKASARIPSAQNFNLNDRTRQASREGLTISGAEADYSLPASLVNRVVHELRGEIIGGLLREISDFDQQTGRKWRIGDIEFGIGGRSDEYTAKGARRATGYEDLLDPYGEGLSGAERISLVAEVCLRTFADSIK
jgi:hypothetical protein